MEVGTQVWIKNDQKSAHLTIMWLPGEVQSKVNLFVLLLFVF
jgi:hypothetical protein